MCRQRTETILRTTGLSRSEITEAANVYMQADNTILVYGMGITQHRYGTQTVQQLANLLLLRGNIGRPGAGLCSFTPSPKAVPIRLLRSDVPS
jgi:anaerobic selenocysteine-containing dehydrogenase